MTSPSLEVVQLQRLREACSSCGVHQYCLPSGLDEEDLRRLDGLIQDRRPLPAGTVLFHAGSPCTALHLVRAGCVMCSMPLENGETQVLGFHFPGDVLGLDGIGSHTHGCTAIALERSRVCELPLTSLHRIACAQPPLQAALDRIISREMLDERAHVAIMGRRIAQQRLAAFLLQLSERHAAMSRDPLTLRLSMSRNDIASYLGLAVETVSRLFTRFQEQGLLDVQRRVIHIRHLQRLHSVAAGEEETATALG